MLSFTTASRRHLPPAAVRNVTSDQRQQVLEFQSIQSSVIHVLQQLLILIQYVLVNGLLSVIRGIQLLWQKTERSRSHYAEQFVRNLMSPSAIFIFVFWPGWLVLGAVCLVWRIVG